MSKLNLIAYPAIAILSLAAAGAALADDITPDNTASQVFTTTKSRAQVQQELVAARADGSIKVWSTSYNQFAAAKSLKTRDEVRADRDASAGYATTFYGEDSGSFALNRLPAVRQAAPLYAAQSVKKAAQ